MCAVQCSVFMCDIHVILFAKLDFKNIYMDFKHLIFKYISIYGNVFPYQLLHQHVKYCIVLIHSLYSGTSF